MPAGPASGSPASTGPELTRPTPAGPTTADPASTGPASGVVSEAGPPGGTATAPATPERLVPTDRARALSARWDTVKGSFVDEPRDAVRQADALVGELLDELDRLFRDQRRELEHGLDNDGTTTEDLRLALRRYRSFFDRLIDL